MLFTGMDVSLSLPPSLSKKEMKKCPLVRIKKRERKKSSTYSKKAVNILEFRQPKCFLCALEVKFVATCISTKIQSCCKLIL